jgi:hypothetical protein
VCYTPKKQAHGSNNVSHYHWLYRLYRLYPDDGMLAPPLIKIICALVINYVLVGLSLEAMAVQI